MKSLFIRHWFNGNPEHSVSLTIEEMARQTCLPIAEIKEAIRELEKKHLITVVRHPLAVPRYIINLDEIERLGSQSKPREV